MSNSTVGTTVSDAPVTQFSRSRISFARLPHPVLALPRIIILTTLRTLCALYTPPSPESASSWISINVPLSLSPTAAQMSVRSLYPSRICVCVDHSLKYFNQHSSPEAAAVKTPRKIPLPFWSSPRGGWFQGKKRSPPRGEHPGNNGS